jgi:hypothetical protein
MSAINQKIAQTKVIFEKLTAINLIKDLSSCNETEISWSTDRQVPLVPVQNTLKFHSL